MPRFAVAQLALDDDERHALASHLDGVGVAQLVRRETPANACGRRRAAQLGARGRGRPWPSPGRAVDDAEQRADRELEAHIDPTLQVLPGPLVHTDLAPAPALAAAHEQGPATVVEVGLVERERRADPKSVRHSTTIRPRSRHPSGPSPAARMTATISSTRGGSAG